MASVRTSKATPLKKGPDANQGSQSPARRTPAWRASPSPGPAYNANAAGNRSTANGFPPLGAQTNGKSSQNAWGSAEDKQQLLAGLAGSINQVITVSLRSNTRFEGTLTFVSPTASDDASLTLKNAKDLSLPNAPIKESMKIAASNVLSFTPGTAGSGTMSKVNDSFRTDTEISRAAPSKRERELQAWKPDATEPPVLPVTGGFDHQSGGDDVTFGPGASTGGQWDQFAANERLFGVRTHFDEDEYTTRLDRSAKDFKERERRAEIIAAEITGTVTTNPHIAEERGIIVDDSGINEEDKYGAVVRGANAYVPPGARRQNSNNNVTAINDSVSKASEKDAQNKSNANIPVPKVSLNAPDGSEKPVPRTSPSPAGGGAAKQPADALPAFRDFVTIERQRLTQKKQALVKNDMEKRVADLVKFSQTFKLNKPIPEDLVPILAKDEDKQRQIREKSSLDAQSTKARAIGVSVSAIAQPKTQTQLGSSTSKPAEPVRKPSAPSASALKPTERVPPSKSATSIAPSAASPSGSKSNTSNGKIESSKTMPRISMVIQQIPPFRGAKKQSSGDGKQSSVNQQPLSPTAQQRLNVNATSFRPNPKAAAFTPTGSSSPQTQAVSPKPKQETIANVPPTPNPFFGNQVIKKGPVNVKEDFNPFKHGKVTEAKAIGHNWPYNGKRYMHMFPAPTVNAPPPQASPHMVPHPPPPPPSYDEDAAAQAQAQAQAAAAASRGGGYALYYAPYYPGQPPQPMMAGMAGVPPGAAFIPSPYMPPMPYPPNMPPPNGQPMYAPPPMGQMPPPQHYMPPPPPGAYPPPPQSGGPRPSMPPTPIPAHAHPYYQQSPQLQHAMPYPMMMPPPGPNAPPHPYEAGPPPPVPMGGVGHA